MSQLMDNTAQHAREEPCLRFKLLPYFAAQKLDLINQNYFKYNSASHFACRKIASYPEFHNPFLENEFKGYIQHIALDLHLSASTLSYQVVYVVPVIENFFMELYPHANSVIDIPLDEIYPQYLEFLADHGYKAVAYSTKHPMANLEVKRYPAKAEIVTGFTRLYKLVYRTAYPDHRSEKEKDIWDIRYLGIPYNTAIARPRYTLNFTNIKQKWLREAAKEYCYYRLQTRTMSAVLDDIKGLNLFSKFLYEQYPDIKGLECVSREEIESFFRFLSLKGFVTTTFNRRISILRTFFSLGSLLDLDGFPDKPLITNQDFRKIPARMPRYYTPSEIERINEHLGELPIQIARMIFVLENCGMRLSDICSSTILIDGRPSLFRNNSNEYIFTYPMPKAHRYNTIPVSELVGTVLDEAIAESREKYGEDCKYIFAKSKDHPIGTEVFVQNANLMAARNNLKKDDGTPLRIRGHAFRSTLATEYANSGISLDVIRMMLGQKSLKVMEHYVKIHDVTMIDAMKPIIEENEHLLQSIGQDESPIWEELKEPALIPLSNGRCAKAVETGICQHADMCYSCKMFRPIKDCIPVYLKQMEDAKANVVIAEIHGYERIKEANLRIISQISAILKKLEGETADCENSEGRE